MSGTAPDTSAIAAEMAASLTLDEIPVKLRCAGCNKLALNAFRMPCCDQSLCESCQDSLESFCPICLHEPVQKGDCKPNKTLRQTIKAFLRKKSIEKETARKKEKPTSLPQQAAVHAISETTNGALFQPQLHTPETTSHRNGSVIDSPQEASQHSSSTPAQELQVSIPQTTTEFDVDIPRPSIETTSEPVQNEKLQASSSYGEQESKGQGYNDPGADQRGQNGGGQGQSGQWPNIIGTGQNIHNGTVGFDGMNGGFPNMGGFPGVGDFGQMMQLMPNAMPNAMIGAFPNLMGLPGMGMDPTAMSQAMYGGFGGPGMGMNGVNGMSGMSMGMGFNAGQGAFGGFNGQADAWNTGQDKFNPNAYGHADGMSGDFGAHTGFGGYNMPSHQGNFNQMNHQQFPHNDFQHGYNGQGFQNRGRGRRGGFNNNGRGRGGYSQVSQGNYGNQANHEPFHHQVPSQLAQQASSQLPKTEQQQDKDLDNMAKESNQISPLEGSNPSQTADEQLSKELNLGEANDKSRTDIVIPQSNGTTSSELEPSEMKTEPGRLTSPQSQHSDAIPHTETVNPEPTEIVISTEHDKKKKSEDVNVTKAERNTMPPPLPAIPLGPAAHYVQDYPNDFGGRGRGSGRAFYRGSTDIRGGYRSRGMAHVSNGAVSSPSQLTAKFPVIAPTEPKGLGVEGAPKGPKALREGLPNTGLRGGRGFSIVGRASAVAQAKPSRPERSSSSRSLSRRRSRSRSPSVSASRHRSGRHRSHRHRSQSASDDDAERERRRERRRRRSHKHEEEEQNGVDGHGESRKRELSLESLTRKSSHRTHRNRERDSSPNGHRQHRERSRERDDERRHRRKRTRSPVDAPVAQTSNSTEVPPISPVTNRAQEKEHSRKRRDRDEDDRTHERKRSRRDRSASQEENEKHRSSRRDKRDRDDSGTNTSNHHSSSKRASAVDKDYETPDTQSTATQQPEKDHHTLEREARNRERLMKELQRREANEGKGASKRKGSGIGSTVGRRVSYNYEDEENDERRVGRVENEREAGRWM